MDERLVELLEFAKSPATSHNLQRDSYCSVFFFDKGNIPCTIIASGFFMVEVEGIRHPSASYNYMTDRFEDVYPYPVPLNEMYDIINNTQYMGSVVFPLRNFINRFEALKGESAESFEMILSKSRLIMSPSFLRRDQGEIAIIFAQENGMMTSSLPGINKKIIVAPESIIPQYQIIPGEAYRCKPVSANEEFVAVNCMAPYGKIRVGIKYSPDGYNPTDIAAINSLVGIPHHLIITSNKVECVNHDMDAVPPIHLTASIVNNVIRLFGLSRSDLIKIHFGFDPNAPIRIEGIGFSEYPIKVNVVLATRNPFCGPQKS
jgi:hypothetical protein